jgi:SAM-dependent methyltransferase
MKLKQRLFRTLVHQFRNPTGAGGHVAGLIMSHRSSNVTRGRWAVEQLAIQPTDRVLELGCGPGVALAALADRAGLAVGVDQSPVMIGQAGRRNRAAVAAGRAQLVHTTVEELLPLERTGDAAAPPFDQPFDAVLAVNNVGFWNDPGGRLTVLRDLIRPGGRVALVNQPRCPGADAATSRAAAADLTDLLETAGYTGIAVETLDLDPPAVCVLGYCPPVTDRPAR